jgi:F0F1-type ATP synthase assembly protein I
MSEVKMYMKRMNRRIMLIGILYVICNLLIIYLAIYG